MLLAAGTAPNARDEPISCSRSRSFDMSHRNCRSIDQNNSKA